MRARSTHHRGISLRDILPEAEFGRTADIRLAACSTDANRCRPGDLFVALVEGDRDGHGQVRRAVAAGASAVVTERPVECGVPFCLVRDTHEAFAQICQALAGQPGQQLKTIGITGGTGRATTAYLAASVLEAGGLAAGIMGSLGYCDGVDSCPPESAHIRPTAAARWLGRMAANQCSHAVIEISPAALRRSALSGVEFDVISVAGQLGRNNSDPNSPGEGELLQSRLVDLMRPEGLAVLEATGATSESILSVLHGPALTVGLEAPAEITASLLEQSASEQLFLLHAGDESVPVRTTLVGQRNLRHCLLAAGIGLAYEIELAAIVRGLENVHRIPGRLERLECGQPFAAFVDDAGSPSAVKNSLQELRPLTGGKLIVVCGAEGECRESQRPWLGRTLS
ncbi:MAG: Mur ligase family protein, partial [Pirellulales bacterium]